MVTIICILGFLGAIAAILLGLAFIGLGGLMTALSPELAGITTLLTALAGMLLVIGIAQLLGYSWLWKMLRKGWLTIIILDTISLVISLAWFTMTSFLDYSVLPGAGINIVIILYLFSKKSLFQQGGAPQQAAQQPPAQVPAQPPVQPGMQ